MFYGHLELLSIVIPLDIFIHSLNKEGKFRNYYFYNIDIQYK